MKITTYKHMIDNLKNLLIFLFGGVVVVIVYEAYLYSMLLWGDEDETR